MLKYAKHDTTRVNIYIDLSNLYRKSNLDSALYFGNKGMELALKIIWNKGLAQCYNKIGNIYTEQGKYDKALNFYLKSLSIAEKLGDSNRMSACYTNIGIIHSYQGSYDKAIEYYHKSLELDIKLGNKKGIASCYNQIGNVYKNYGSSLNNLKVKSEKIDKAIEYFEKSLKIFEELGDKNGISYCYNNMGGVFFSQGNSTSDTKIRADYYNKTLDCFLKSLKIFNELGDKNKIAAVKSNIAGLYCTIADSTETKSYYNEAIKYGLEAIQIAKEKKALSTENIAARVLQKAYKGIDNTTKALKFAEIVIATKDRRKNESNSRNGNKIPD
ncbi:MAG: tetratricopeptide repeat protein [Bacteroidia bacterium]|nr:tetratricopeptide repeat protein [Bacteroidia bacterium]